MKSVLTALLVLVLVIPAIATIINVPADQPSIQAGINASVSGDTVRVAPGTYVENINYSGKNVVVASWFLDASDTSYISLTIIDGNQAGPVVSFLSGENNSAVITGFTMQNGNNTNGGGIYCSASNPTINYNKISGNTANMRGGGIYCSFSNPAISQNTIIGNLAIYGAGIYLDYSSIPISYNTITGNAASDWGGGIFCFHCSPAISNCTLCGNSASYYGGGIACTGSNPVITNSIFWGDNAPAAPEIYPWGTSSPVITYCDVQGGWTGEGNIDCDPMFCDRESGDLNLYNFSCCAGAGMGGIDIGAFGVGCIGEFQVINIPADYPTIQEGIDASSHHDTVRVAPGTYFENINFNGKHIILGSWFLDDGDTSYISSTIIDGNQSGSVVSFLNDEEIDAVITGFTIQNGFGTNGGGIYCNSTSPTINHNIIRGNSASQFGGGIYCNFYAPTISSNIFEGNSANNGGGIYCNSSSSMINYNTISGNSASQNGGGIYCNSSNSMINHNKISGNSASNGGGIYLVGSGPTISYNTISGNSAGYGGGGGICSWQDSNPTISHNTLSANSVSGGYGAGIRSYNSNLVINNTIFWGDIAPSEPEIYADGGSLVITYCDVQGGWAGEGNINCDPMFCHPDTGNYYLHARSCCVGSGEGGNDIGAFGVGCDSPNLINIPSDYQTIQEGIDASYYGDTVRVAPGTYIENINFNGKNIVLGSWFLDDGDTVYISSTIIDGNQSGSVVYFLNGENSDAVVTGFTIQNGHGTNGGGIYCNSSSPTINHNIISGNSVSQDGGGIFCNYFNSTISDNSIAGNSAGWDGGGIYLNHSSAMINLNTITGNTASTWGGGICCVGSGHTISNNTITGNSAGWYGGGICCGSCGPAISNNTITANSANSRGGGISCVDQSSAIITNTIVRGDRAPDQPEVDSDGSAVITYCDVEGGWAGTGNIDCDPMFCDPEAGNYYLHAYSCCVGAGEGGLNIGALEIGCRWPNVISVVPAQNEFNVPIGASIAVTFDRDMDPATINDSTYIVSGRSSGRHSGTISYDGPMRTATIDPASDFQQGEAVNVVLTAEITSTGVPLGSGYTWQFNIAARGTGVFAVPVDYIAGSGPYSISAADLDGDGDNDLAAANDYSNDVSILINNSDGTYQAKVDYGVGSCPYSVFAADLDGDGDNDLAVANTCSNNISILRNIGDGTFQAAVNYGTGSGPSSAFAIDLDGDGDNDLAVTNANSNNISILKNNNDGTFQDPVNYGVGSQPYSVFAADLDGDGDNDLAVGNTFSDNISILMNNGNGTFQGAVNYGTGRGPSSIFAADFDGDSANDLAVANSFSDDISILGNNGDGTFQAAVNYGAGSSPSSVFAADLDGDGDLDLATANYGSSNASILSNNGDGTFQAAVNFEVGGNPFSVFAADLNGDGDNDLALANAGYNYVSVLMNMDSPGAIAGTIMDDGMNPIQGAHVIALGTLVEDTTDISGAYCLDSLGVGIYDISITHIDYRDTSVMGVAVASRDTTELDVILEALPGLIKGTVIDLAGDPIESVYVEFSEGGIILAKTGNPLIPAMPNKAKRVTEEGVQNIILIQSPSQDDDAKQILLTEPVYTDSNGYYQAVISAGSYDISYSHPEYYDTILTEIGITPGDTTIEDVTLRILPGYIAGRVWGRDSIPLENVHVAISDTSLDTFTDSSGNYLIAGIVPGLHSVLFSHPDYTTILLDDVEVTPEDTTWENVILNQLPGFVRGEVINQQEQPLLDVIVSIGEGSLIDTTGADGMFAFDNLPADLYNISFHKSGYKDTILSAVEVTPGDTTYQDMILEELFGAVGGMVTNVDGHGIDGVLVEAEGTSINGYTDSSGVYLLSELEAGPYSMRFSHPLYLDTILQTEVIAGDTTELNVTLYGICQYVVGDANNSGSLNGLDVTYGVAYFKGGPPPAYSCECTPGHTWFVSGDVNASCSYNGLDITYAVAYFKGGPGPQPCSNCPPAGLLGTLAPDILPAPGVQPVNPPTRVPKKPIKAISQ